MEPFRPEHLTTLAAQERLTLSPLYREWLHAGYRASLAWTGFVNDRPLACVGLFVQRAVGYTWAVVSAEAKSHAVFTHRTVARYLRSILRDLPVRRLEALVVLPDDIGAGRWLERLGFWCAERNIGHDEQRADRYIRDGRPG